MRKTEVSEHESSIIRAEQPAPLTKADIQPGELYKHRSADLFVMATDNQDQSLAGLGRFAGVCMNTVPYTDYFSKGQYQDDWLLPSFEPYTAPEDTPTMHALLHEVMSCVGGGIRFDLQQRIVATLGGSTGVALQERVPFGEKFFCNPAAWQIETRDGRVVHDVRKSISTADQYILTGTVGAEGKWWDMDGRHTADVEHAVTFDLFMRPVAAPVATASAPVEDDQQPSETVLGLEWVIETLEREGVDSKSYYAQRALDELRSICKSLASAPRDLHVEPAPTMSALKDEIAAGAAPQQGLSQGERELLALLESVRKNCPADEDQTKDWMLTCKAMDDAITRFSDRAVGAPQQGQGDAQLLEAAERLMAVINSAGIWRLSNGVELGATSWLHKAENAMNGMADAIANHKAASEGGAPDPEAAHRRELRSIGKHIEYIAGRMDDANWEDSEESPQRLFKRLAKDLRYVVSTINGGTDKEADAKS